MADMHNSISVVAAALGDDPRQTPRTARSLGFAGLLFDAFGTAIDLTELSITGRREFLHVLSAADQQLAGLRVELEPKGFGPGADVDRVLARFSKVMDAARGFATPLICADL